LAHDPERLQLFGQDHAQNQRDWSANDSALASLEQKRMTRDEIIEVF